MQSLCLLLTHGYFLAEDPKESQIMKPYPPMGILYLSSHLRSKGLDVEIYDSTFGSREELECILQRGPAGVLGIYGNLMTRGNVLALTECARAAGWLVMLGGPEPSNYADEYLNAGAHLIVAGEAELAVERLMRANFARERWAAIPGLLYQGADGTVSNSGPAEMLHDLDAQPWPDRERIDLSRYLDVWRSHHGVGSVSVITARGCPYRCNWCSHSVYGHTHRRRSPRAVVEEIAWLIDRYHPEMLWIADDVFTIHHGWLAEYRAEMKRQGIRLPFECITRADRLNENAAQLLAELGCMRVWIGSESGSQRILDAMQRGVTVAQVRRAVALAKSHGIATGMFLMWGYEGEDLGDVEATIEHVKACQPDVFFTTVSYPIKGTPYFDKVGSRLVTLRPWQQSSDREISVKGRHSRAFYLHADDLLRAEMARERDPQKIRIAREELLATRHEVEA
jgi:anaerobic magnesium-protoporphyrin IX monomethyl ester cyclase